jgi:hypothetical protein
MLVWFECRKAEPEVDGAVIDWTVTTDTTIRAAFRAHLATQDWLRFAPVEDERSSRE